MPQLNPNAPKPHVLLQRALRLFGPKGERWTKGAFERLPDYKWPNGAFCSIGALNEVNTANRPLAEHYLGRALETIQPNTSGVISYNDARHRRFSQIQKLFKAAIALAKEQGR